MDIGEEKRHVTFEPVSPMSEPAPSEPTPAPAEAPAAEPVKEPEPVGV